MGTDKLLDPLNLPQTTTTPIRMGIHTAPATPAPHEAEGTPLKKIGGELMNHLNITNGRTNWEAEA